MEDYDSPQGRPDDEGSAQFPPALELDVNMYLSHLDEFDMTDEQKIEFLQTLWATMRTLVELNCHFDVVGYVFGAEEEKE